MTKSTEVFADRITLARRDHVRTLTIDRPQVKNALDPDGWDALGDALQRVAQDPEARVLVFTGAGGDFCSGTDLGGARDEHPTMRLRRLNRAAALLHDMPLPVIAQVEGVAVGAGWNMALLCDFVIASTTARFGALFTRRGLSPDFGGSWLLPRLVGLQQAKRLALLPELIGAQEAADLGLVSWVQEPEELAPFVASIADKLAAGPPVALAQTKRLLNSAADTAFRAALDAEASAQLVNFATVDAVTAREAFLAKEKPTFTGAWNAR